MPLDDLARSFLQGILVDLIQPLFEDEKMKSNKILNKQREQLTGRQRAVAWCSVNLSTLGYLLIFLGTLLLLSGGSELILYLAGLSLLAMSLFQGLVWLICLCLNNSAYTLRELIYICYRQRSWMLPALHFFPPVLGLGLLVAAVLLKP